MTTYNDAIPQPGDFLSQSQGEILGNFDQLNVQFGVDHTAFNTGSGNGDGFHKKVTFPGTASFTPPAGTESVIFPSNISGAQELFYQNATAYTQITSSFLPIWKGGNPAGDGVVVSNLAANGYMKLPTGLTFQWGIASTSGGTGTQGFSVAFTALYSLTITPVAGVANFNYTIASTTLSGFAIAQSTATAIGYFWQAMGTS